MSTLINMEMSKQEAEEYTKPSPDEGPKYPWGLCITLNDDSLEKLGVDALPGVETEVTIVAKAQVSRISENQTQGGEACRSMDLQITDMQIGGLGADLAGRATKALYGKAKQVALILFVLLGTVIGAHAQGVIHGSGNPQTLIPTPNCAQSRFYVDDSTGKMYQANSGSPCSWVDSSTASLPPGFAGDGANGIVVTGNAAFNGGASFYGSGANAGRGLQLQELGGTYQIGSFGTTEWLKLVSIANIQLAAGTSVYIDAGSSSFSANVGNQVAGEPVNIGSSTSPVAFDGGASAVLRCTTAGTLPIGALTITSGNCGASTDTGIRIK